MLDALSEAHARLEQALAEALERITAVGNPAEIERMIKLIIQHKIVAGMLFEAMEAGIHYGQSAANTETYNQMVSMNDSNQTEDSGSSQSSKTTEDERDLDPAFEKVKDVEASGPAPS